MSEEQHKADELVAKYAKRFLSVYHNIQARENLDGAADVGKALSLAAITIGLSESLTQAEASVISPNPQQYERAVRKWLGDFNDLAIAQFEGIMSSN